VGYASKLGRARINSRNPQAAAICDRCGFVYNHVDLQFQFDWAGATTVNKQILVCNNCLDTPQQQLRAIVIPADPMPISNPRPQEYRVAEANVRVTTNRYVPDGKTGIPVPDLNPPPTASGQPTQPAGTTRTTQVNDTRVTQQTGAPNGTLNQQPGTDPNAPGNDDPGLPYRNVDVPNTGPLK
jgi:hypothetical protein